VSGTMLFVSIEYRPLEFVYILCRNWRANHCEKELNIKQIESNYLSIKLHSVACYSPIIVKRIADKLNNARYSCIF